MSQAGKVFDGSPIPDMETLTGDTGGPVAGDALFNIDLLGDDFITTTGTPLTNTVTISEIGAVKGTGQTIGAVTADLITLSLGATPTTYIIEAKIAAFEATTPAGTAYNLIAGARTTGAASALTSVPDKLVLEEVALAAADVDFIAAANTIIIRCTGIVGLTINWAATIKYIKV